MSRALFTAEFRRNLWLEFSPQRLIALPAIVAVLVLLSQVVNGDSPGDLAELGSWLFYVMVFLWGSRRAAASVAEEVNSGTWIGQRLSALSPAALVFGKLFGATSYIWFGGLLGLALYAYGAVAAGATAPWIAWQLLQLVASGVLLHALAVAVALVLLNKRTAVTRLGSTGPQLLALLAALIFIGIFARFSLFGSFVAWDQRVVWYGTSYQGQSFVALTTLIFALWSLLACWRLMAQQLQRARLPWGWALFTLFLIAFVEGFSESFVGFDDNLVTLAAVPVGIATLGFYVAVFAERNEPLRFRQFFAAVATRQRYRALTLLPWWVPSWLILVAATLWQLDGVVFESGLLGDITQSLHLGEPLPWASSFALLGFTLRDLAFVLFMNSARRNQRADLTAFIYLIVFYGPLQALILGMQAYEVVTWLVPLPVAVSWMPLASALVQAGLLLYLTSRRWKRLF